MLKALKTQNVGNSWYGDFRYCQSIIVRAMQPARWRCVTHMALRKFAPAFDAKNPKEVTLRVYLARRFDSLVVGLHEWGCSG